MNILIIGSGGREHAIARAVKRSRPNIEVYALPGNGGMEDVTCVDIASTDIEGIKEYIKSAPEFYMVIIAQDDPLALGLTDELEAMGCRVFGPKKAAAKIEWSKAFSKDLMHKYNIPTAQYRIFSDYTQAIEYARTCGLPQVLKADGLALGKGVLICRTREELVSAVNAVMRDLAFGTAGNKVVFEEFLTGYEVSVLAFCDAKTVVPMVSACDYKRAMEADKGLNTGGMGAYSPCPSFDKALQKEFETNIMQKTLDALNAEGIDYKGVIYFGLMVTESGIKVIEYNSRFGDPEAQVVLPRLTTDIITVFDAVIEGRLKDVDLAWDDRAAVCVVAASEGYPQSYRKGFKISVGRIDGAEIYFSGVKKQNGELVTNGGRVLCVSALGNTIEAAREAAYKNIAQIYFDNIYYRKDIARCK